MVGAFECVLQGVSVRLVLLDDAEPQELVDHRFLDIDSQGVLAFGDCEAYRATLISRCQWYLPGELLIDLINRSHGYLRGIGKRIRFQNHVKFGRF